MTNIQDKFDRIVASFDGASDSSVWRTACTVVVLAGRRAAQTGNRDVNIACARFIREMHELVGTPTFEREELQ